MNQFVPQYMIGLGMCWRYRHYYAVFERFGYSAGGGSYNTPNSTGLLKIGVVGVKYQWVLVLNGILENSLVQGVPFFGPLSKLSYKSIILQVVIYFNVYSI